MPEDNRWWLILVVIFLMPISGYESSRYAGQVAQGMGRLYVAREMFRMVVLHFPQPRYQYYAAQARLGLERLDAARRVCRKLPHLVTRCQHDI